MHSRPILIAGGCDVGPGSVFLTITVQSLNINDVPFRRNKLCFRKFDQK